MIATRFRSVYWVGGVAVAALGCYLVSQRVAAERATLARVETEIVQGQRQIRMLETEVGARAGMNQIERWNTDVLSLSAPRAGQFVDSEVQLAALVQPVQPAMEAPAAIVQAVAAAPAPRVPQVTQVTFSAPAPRSEKPEIVRAPAARERAQRRAEEDAPRIRQPKMVRASFDATDRDAEDETPRVRQAVFMKPGKGEQSALLDDKLLGDLGRLAASERTGGKRRR